MTSTSPSWLASSHLMALSHLVSDGLADSLHVEAVALQSILGRDPLLLLVIFRLKLLSVVYHRLNLLLGEPAIGDHDLVLLSSRFVDAAGSERLGENMYKELI